MPSNYVADGPAEVGFQAYGQNIAYGVQVSGQKEGVEGRGPIGVHGEGNIGVLGVGKGGPGGKFISDNADAAQVNVSPHLMADVGKAVPAQPEQFVRLNSLPKWGTEGDFFLGRYVTGQTKGCALWICIQSSVPLPPANPALPPTSSAHWSQVLLGIPVEGQFVDHTP